MNIDRVLAGKKAKSDGDYFERLINEACERYKREGFAYIEKTPEPMKVIKPYSIPRGQFIAHFDTTAQPDYKGTLSGGRAICFEAKCTGKDKILQDRVTDAQTDALLTHAKLGAEVFILVGFFSQIVPSFYKIPFQIWYEMKTIYGRKYVLETEIQDFKVGEQHIVDFLEVDKKRWLVKK